MTIEKNAYLATINNKVVYDKTFKTIESNFKYNRFFNNGDIQIDGRAVQYLLTWPKEGIDWANDLNIYNPASNFTRKVNIVPFHLPRILDKVYYEITNEERLLEALESDSALKDFTNKLLEQTADKVNIDLGVEYLPDSLKIFYCQNLQRPNAKIKEIIKVLKNYRGNDKFGLPRQYNIQKWKQDNVYLIEKAKRTNELEKQTKSLQKKLQTVEANHNASQQELEINQSELKMLQGNDLVYKQFIYTYLQSKKEEAESIIENIKEKLSSKNLKKSFERFLNNQNDNDRKKLEKTSSWEEINSLLIKQKEIIELEQQLNNLKFQETETKEQLAQIQVPPKR